jgi:type IV secretory pathway VirB2 component (pilin)
LPDGPRLLYRSRHIYLLLAGLINLGIGAYLAYRPDGWRRTVQTIGSVLPAAGAALLLAGFFREPSRGPNQTMLAAIGIYATALGTMLHVVSATWRRTTGETRND